MSIIEKPMTKGILMMIIMKGLPYCENINDLDFECEDAILFTWRETQYKVSTTLFTLTKEENEICWSGGSKAILLEALLLRVYLQILEP